MPELIKFLKHSNTHRYPRILCTMNRIPLNPKPCPQTNLPKHRSRARLSLDRSNAKPVTVCSYYRASGQVVGHIRGAPGRKKKKKKTVRTPGPGSFGQPSKSKGKKKAPPKPPRTLMDQRAANIERNRNRMEELGLPGAAEAWRGLGVINRAEGRKNPRSAVAGGQSPYGAGAGSGAGSGAGAGGGGKKKKKKKDTGPVRRSSRIARAHPRRNPKRKAKK